MGCDGEQVALATTASDDNDDDIGCDGTDVAPATRDLDDDDDDRRRLGAVATNISVVVVIVSSLSQHFVSDGCPMCRDGNVDGSDQSGNGAGEPAIVARFPSGNMSCKNNTATEGQGITSMGSARTSNVGRTPCSHPDTN